MRDDPLRFAFDGRRAIGHEGCLTGQDVIDAGAQQRPVCLGDVEMAAEIELGALADSVSDALGMDEAMGEVGLSVLRASGLCAPHEHTTTIAGGRAAGNPTDTIMALHCAPPNPYPLESTTYGDGPLEIPPKSTKWSAILLNMG